MPVRRQHSAPNLLPVLGEQCGYAARLFGREQVSGGGQHRHPRVGVGGSV